MTNTIPNVPRELLEVIEQTWRIHYNGGPVTTDIAADAIEKGLGQLRALLSAPSPAGVGGLKRYEVFPYLDDEVAELDICESDDGTFVKYDDARAIIDGLLGENKALHAQVKVLQSDANSWQSGYDEGRRMGGKHCSLTIDQQAQRIGKLEGLLRDSAELIKHGVFEDGYCCCGSSVDSHVLGDGHSPVDALAYHAGQVCERIDAALSAGKEGE